MRWDHFYRFLADAEQATLNWINAGMNAGMGWFTEEHARRACRPADLVSNARSVIHLAKCYLPPGSSPLHISGGASGSSLDTPGEKTITQYSPDDRRVVDMVTGYIGARPNARIFVDSGPLAEKQQPFERGSAGMGRIAQ